MFYENNYKSPEAKICDQSTTLPSVPHCLTIIFNMAECEIRQRKLRRCVLPPNNVLTSLTVKHLLFGQSLITPELKKDFIRILHFVLESISNHLNKSRRENRKHGSKYVKLRLSFKKFVISQS